MLTIIATYLSGTITVASETLEGMFLVNNLPNTQRRTPKPLAADSRSWYGVRSLWNAHWPSNLGKNMPSNISLVTVIAPLPGNNLCYQAMDKN